MRDFNDYLANPSDAFLHSEDGSMHLCHDAQEALEEQAHLMFCDEWRLLVAEKKILDRIRKCLALSRSGNEHEAAAALRQARKLMQMYAVTEADILAVEVSEGRVRAGAKKTPALWEAALASIIANAFGCRLIIEGGYTNPGHWIFVGCGPAPEIARYAFDVLFRQAKLARAEYMKSSLSRCTRGTKTRRADLYCEGWVRSASNKVYALAVSERQAEAIQAYMAKHHSGLGECGTLNRNEGRALRRSEAMDYLSGAHAGQQAQIHHGVDGKQSTLALEGVRP